MTAIKIAHSQRPIRAKINLVASKSECNRALIIHALTGNQCKLHNVSAARDSVTLQQLLSSSSEILDVIDAGTTMRFLTAYSCLQPGTRILTGTPRMCERPIGILVDALRSIGATIEYLQHEGFPPIKVTGPLHQTNKTVQMRGDVSSQFISAMLLIAPCLPLGLDLHLTGEIGSRPYINMTLKMMADFGIAVPVTWDRDIIILPKPYTPSEFYIESDWSGASYWYSIAALAENAEIELIGLKKDSLQGDSVIAKLMEPLGVESTYGTHSVTLRKKTTILLPKQLEIDFSECPDIAQTMAVACAALGVNLQMTGVESLKVKETDRLAALKSELLKIGVSLTEISPQKYLVDSSGYFERTDDLFIRTYLDHRMAMAFAPLALKKPLTLEEKEVVVKSYPSYWDDLQKVGFILS